ncbi:NAD(P)H-dependent flavin oxidoreductase [Clostridium omnivorum]|uniref:Probable nitronate monooxygenase n=1 Tax=Clostridium omnivorum TaxID=1604902 RepID=A0ABQ5N3R9_9CLOT|nr:nitronate monooxygenase family protein [Clostridium sp. E14]GLC29872.1 2-nitropropane dioxygenase [Clostridium sp. E14]
MKLPELTIGNIKALVPIIQGGMGIGVSLHKLAAAVAAEGGIGIISGAQPGFAEPDFIKNTLGANLRALKNEIRLAKEKCKNGIIGVNLMVATNGYAEYVKAAIEAKADLIISGAGLPLELPKLTQGSDIKIAPIVSSAKAISVICKMWEKRYNATPDMVIVEGPEAGGHLGFSKNDELLNKPSALEQIVVEVKQALNTFENKYNKSIPVIAAGGIFDGKDIAKFLSLGASGVQMATRFVATEECDADENYKKAYVEAKKEDIQIVVSPVGMPGRAIRNKFIEKVEGGSQKVKCLYNCLKPCDPKSTPYCISEALINAREGNVDDGLIFCGSNVYRIDKIVPVKELIHELVTEAELNYRGIDSISI